MLDKYDTIRAIQWQDNNLVLLDQRKLPHEKIHLTLTSVAEVANAIRDMVVRGAPAIGITAAYGIVIAARERFANNASNWKQAIAEDIDLLAQSRPTAVNLFWAIERMRDLLNNMEGDPVPRLLDEAHAILKEDIAANKTMGEKGAALIEPGSGVLTHCNTGSLATGGFGTALGVIRTAWAQGKLGEVYATETRPWLQGARLTAWELQQDKIPVKLIVDSAAGWLMKQGKIQWVIVGADRIAANGDVANKIGTYSLAVLAREHGVNFMVVAPTSTVDKDISSGKDIPIETRSGDEIFYAGNNRIAAENIEGWNPVFDVTPNRFVTELISH
jgi:methylthioribose-1-phosphate isomerase